MSEPVQRNVHAKSAASTFQVAEREGLNDTVLDLKMKRERREIRKKKRLEKKGNSTVPSTMSNIESSNQLNGSKLVSYQDTENNNLNLARSLTLKLKRPVPEGSAIKSLSEILPTQQVNKDVANAPAISIGSSTTSSSRQSDDQFPSKATSQKAEKNRMPKQHTMRLQVNQDQRPSFEWPKSSATSLPALPLSTRSQVKSENFCFPINEECTSLCIPPSGRHIAAGFTDGTLRLFDTTGRLWTGENLSNGKYIHAQGEDCTNQIKGNMKRDSSIGDDDDIFCTDSNSEAEEGDSAPIKKEKAERSVLSKSHQKFGAVACQIHARGVNTSLLMDVACSEDGLFSFGGVLRGSTELVAVDMSNIELYHDRFNDNLSDKKTPKNKNEKKKDILDLIKVYSFSDAKLKGFGACTRLKNGHHSLEYRLFTGKGIKNMHIWSFIPPQGNIKEPIWQCLYDTPTNGNTITQLHFRHDSNGLLQGITKSDDQKLRVWDLSFELNDEEYTGNGPHSIIKQLAKKAHMEREKGHGKPRRPPYVDVNLTENALGVCGPYLFSGGSGMYHKMGVMHLDVKDIQSPFNHTEIALPNAKGNEKGTMWSEVRSSRSSRQQRGELKSAVSVAGLSSDASHVVLELSNGSMVHYSQSGSEPSVELLSPNIYTAPHDLPVTLQDIPCGRQICVSLLGSEGLPVLATSSFDTNLGRGSLILRQLPSTCKREEEVPEGFWGFHGVCQLSRVSKRKQIQAASTDTNRRSKRQKESHVAVSCATKSLPASHGSKESSSENCTEKPKKNRKVKESTVSSTKLPTSSKVTSQKNESLKRMDLSTKANEIKPSITPQSTCTKILKKSRSRQSMCKTSKLPDSSYTGTIESQDRVLQIPTSTGSMGKMHAPLKPAIAKSIGKISDSGGTMKNQDSGGTMKNQGDTSKIVRTCNQDTRVSHIVSKADLLKPVDTLTLAKELEKAKTSSQNSRKFCSPTPGNGSQDAIYHPELLSQIRDTKCHSNEQGIQSNIGVVSNNRKGRETKRLVNITPPKKKKDKQLTRDVNAQLLPTDKITPLQQTMQCQSKNKKKLDVTRKKTNISVCASPQAGSTGGSSGYAQINTSFDSPPHHEKAITSISPPNDNHADGLKTPVRSLPFNDVVENVPWTPPTGVAVSPDHRSSDESPKTEDHNRETVFDGEEENGTIVKFLRSKGERDKQIKPVEDREKCSKSVKDTKTGTRSPNRKGASRKILTVSKSKVRSTKTETKTDQRIDVEISEVLLSMKHQKRKWSLSPQRLSKESDNLPIPPCNEHKFPKLIKETRKSAAAAAAAAASASKNLVNFLAPLYDQTEVPPFVFNDDSFDHQSSVTREHILKAHDTARRKMALHHRASHKRLRNEVLRSVERTMNIFRSKDFDQSNSESKILEGAKGWLENTLNNQEEALGDMIAVQKMEASALWAMQTFEMDVERVPELQVCFPFVDVFTQARQITLPFLVDECDSCST